MQPHPLINFEIMKYYENESKFNGVYFRDNLPNKIKDGAYVVNLDEYSDTGTHWVALSVNINNVTYFDSFGVEHVPKEIKAFIKNKNVKTNIFTIIIVKTSLIFIYLYLYLYYIYIFISHIHF